MQNKNYTIPVQKKDNFLVSWFKWLGHQLSGWGVPNYALFFFALGMQTVLLVNNPITLISVITFIGTILGVGTVVAINAVKPINGLIGIISAGCLIYVGFTAQNYLSMLEQVAYILTLDLPILIGSNKWDDNSVNKLRTFGLKEWFYSIAFTVVVWLSSSFAIQALTTEPRPLIDGLSFAICLTAGILCWRKYNNQYYWWLASGIIQVILWGVTFSQGGASMAMLLSCLVYVMNDVIAFIYSPWFKKKYIK